MSFERIEEPYREESEDAEKVSAPEEIEKIGNQALTDIFETMTADQLEVLVEELNNRAVELSAFANPEDFSEAVKSLKAWIEAGASTDDSNNLDKLVYALRQE